MFNRKQIEIFTSKYVNQTGLKHISDMLEEIQNRMFSQIQDKLYYTPDKFTKDKAGKRNSKFIELCANGNWKDALFIADARNKEILSGTPLFQEFIDKVKSSPGYIAIKRNMTLSSIFSDEIDKKIFYSKNIIT